MDINQVVAAREGHGNRRIAAFDGDGAVPEDGGRLFRRGDWRTGQRAAGRGLEPPAAPPPKFEPGAGGSNIQVLRGPVSLRPRPTPAPADIPAIPFLEWATIIFRSSTGGAPFEDGVGCMYCVWTVDVWVGARR